MPQRVYMLVTGSMVTAILLLHPADTANADADTLLHRCFTPAQTAARPNEKRVVKGITQFDRREKKRVLAAYKPIPQNMRGSIRRVNLPPGDKRIALTLDLCEQPGEVAGYDGAIFDYLRAQRVPVTVFSGGKWMRSHAERTRQLLADPNIEVANHAAGHHNLRLLSGSRLEREINDPQRAYEAIRSDLAGHQCVRSAPGGIASVPARMRLFRFPFGACNHRAMHAVNEAGLIAVQWDVSTGDPWRGQSAKAIAKVMQKNVRPGSIILAHANGRGHNTASALPLAIPALRKKGFVFVTVSELLRDGEPEITPTCFDSRPGDTNKYDNFARAVTKRRFRHTR